VSLNFTIIHFPILAILLPTAHNSGYIMKSQELFTDNDVNAASSITMPTISEIGYFSLKNSDYINLSSSSDHGVTTGNMNKSDPKILESVTVESMLNHLNHTIIIS
jgi:hypothetical protein